MPGEPSITNGSPCSIGLSDFSVMKRRSPPSCATMSDSKVSANRTPRHSAHDDSSTLASAFESGATSSTRGSAAHTRRTRDASPSSCRSSSALNGARDSGGAAAASAVATARCPAHAIALPSQKP